MTRRFRPSWEDSVKPDNSKEQHLGRTMSPEEIATMKHEYVADLVAHTLGVLIGKTERALEDFLFTTTPSLWASRGSVYNKLDVMMEQPLAVLIRMQDYRRTSCRRPTEDAKMRELAAWLREMADYIDPRPECN